MMSEHSIIAPEINLGDARATVEGLPAERSILSLYREWDAKHRHANRKGAGYSEDEMAALCREHDVIVNQMCALDSYSPLDVLAKIIAASGKMEYPVTGGWEDSIRDEALAMLGVQS